MHEIAGQGTKGTASVVEGKLRYDPGADENGVDSFDYRASDGTAASDAAAVAVTIAAVDDPPEAGADGETASAGGVVVLEPVANDLPGPADESGQTLVLDAITAPPSYGAAVIDDGKVRYTPPPRYSGPDWLDYRVCQEAAGGGEALCDTATISLEVWRVRPTAETEPVHNAGDAADDAAIWLHPSDPALSTIVATDKGGTAATGGLAVYDLSGRELQYVEGGRMNNVDVRDGFPLAGASVSLVAASDRTNKRIALFRLDPETRTLADDVASAGIDLGFEPYGLCTYRSAETGRFYVFVTRENSPGDTEQWELFETTGGKVDARRVRAFSVGSLTEGCVADDELGVVYLAEEDVGIWRYGAEPGDGGERTLVDSTGPDGHLVADVEGLAIVRDASGGGYLFASSQGSSSFVVYRRTGANAFVRSFTVKGGDGVDAIGSSDGIDVTSAGLGAAFPHGLLVAQDGCNSAEPCAPGSTFPNQNYKLVPLELVLGDGSVDVPSRPTSCTRPYAHSSPWNAPIGAAPPYDPESDFHVTAFGTSTLSSDSSQFTYPVYEVSTETPFQPVTLSQNGWYSNVTSESTITSQKGGTVQLPIPQGAAAAAGADRQIILVNPETGDEWGASYLERDAATGAWTAWNAYHYDTHWSGVPPYGETSTDRFYSRGAGVPYLAGLVRPCEIARGRIEHALAFAYDFPTAEFVYPATKSDGEAWDGVDDELDSHPGDVPEGTRLQLDPTLTAAEIQAGGCTGPCLTIALALQEYGMYVIDNARRPKVMLEYGGTAAWNGAVDEDTVSPIPLSAFKVLAGPS